MKNINVFYWIVTILFAAFMTSTAIPDILVTPETDAFMTKLGYPRYFTPFIGYAKLIGAIAILIPGLNRLKEWAYAGFFFDLFGATYSVIASEGGFQAPMLFMLLPFTLMFLSYYLWHKRTEQTGKL